MPVFIPLAQHLRESRKAAKVVAEPPPAPAPPPPPPDPGRVARERAHAEAMASLAAAEAEARDAAKVLKEVADAIEGMRQGLLTEARATTAAVILEASRRIAGQALHVEPALLAAIVEEAVGALGREGLTVRVAPADFDAVRRAVADSGIVVVEDPAVDGGCICEGPSGRIDASVSCAVAAVAAVLEQWK